MQQIMNQLVCVAIISSWLGIKKFYENSSLELLNVQICQKLSIRDKVRAKAKLQVKIACSSDFFPN